MSEVAVRERVEAFLKARPDLNIDRLTAHTGLALSTGRGFISGCIPRCNSARVEEQFGRVLRLAQQGEILAPGGPNVVTISDAPTDGRARRVARRRDFYQIETVRRVAQVLDYCAEHAAIGVVTGEYGAGKTEAVKAWRSGAGRKVESAVIEFDSFMAANRLIFVQSVAEQIGLAGSEARADRIFQQVCQALRQSPCLLILDQCEMVHVRVFQIIRQIWDRTHEEGVGIVLLAAPVMLRQMLSSRARDLGALTSRVGVWAPLSGVSKAEMAAILKTEGITEIDESAFDLWWKATQGSMRRLMRAVDLLKAKHAGKRVTVKTIAGVAGHLWGMTVAGVEEAA